MSRGTGHRSQLRATLNGTRSCYLTVVESSDLCFLPTKSCTSEYHVSTSQFARPSSLSLYLSGVI